MNYLDHMMKLAEDQARRILIGTKAQLTPMWLLIGEDLTVDVVATPWADNRQKHAVIERMRSLMRARHTTAYSMLTEAWYSVVPQSEVRKEYTGPPVRERADRRECVVAMAVSKDGPILHTHWEIIRDKRGACAELRRMNGPEDQISGIFDNLLEDRRRAN